MTDTTTAAAEGSPTPTSPNGDLPAVREAIIEQGLRLSQEVAAERDSLRLLLADRDTTIAGLRAQLSVAELEASQLRSRADSVMAIRDEAVARRASVETVLEAMMALGRAFQIRNSPLVREQETTDGYEDNLNRDDRAPNVDVGAR